MNGPIAKLAALLARVVDSDDLGDILEPEGCLEIWLDGKLYHVTIAPMPGELDNALAAVTDASNRPR